MKTSQRISLLLGFLAAVSFSAFADQNAILSNGASIRHARREVREEVTRLYLPGEENNFVDVPTEDIVGYEDIKPLPAPSAIATRTAPPAKMPLDSMPALPPKPLNAVINAAGYRNNVNPALIDSMIRVESNFNARAVSPKGAQGLMQLMPETAARLGVRDAMDAVANIEGGTRYIRELLERYNLDLVKALAAYNAGPERVEQYNGVPPYPETISYITKVINDFNKKKPGENRDLGRTKRKRTAVATAQHPGTIFEAEKESEPSTPIGTGSL